MIRVLLTALLLLAAWPTHAQLPGLFTLLPNEVAAGGVANVIKTDSDLLSTGSSTPTFTVDIGTASPDRYVIACVEIIFGSSGSISSMTVGGAATTQLVSILYDGSQRQTACYITSAAFTSGTTASIVTTTSISANNTGIQVYAATGLNSITPTATATDDTDPYSQSLAVSAGGFIVAAYRINAITTVTWGGTGLTEDYDYQGSLNNTYSSASGNYAAGATPTVSVTPGSGAFGGLVAAAMR